MPGLTVCYCDVKICMDLLNDIIGCKIKIAPHYRHDDIAHKGCHCLMMIALKYQHVACMISYRTSDLELST